jgi:hypothetical protein
VIVTRSRPEWPDRNVGHLLGTCRSGLRRAAMPKRALQTALPGQSTTVRSGKSKIPNGRWCYGLSLVILAVPSAVLRVE